MPSIIALVPARKGSRRVPGKNIKLLGGKPLIVWSIQSAQASGIFDRVIVCTDSIEYGGIAHYADAEVFMRADSPDDEPDVVWVRRALLCTQADAFAILRPTSPFRTAESIKQAWESFLTNQPADSLRAVEPVRQHPGKMWVLRDGRIVPLLPFQTGLAPWHSSPTQTLPVVLVQNASLEIAWVKTVMQLGSIAGVNVLPFFVENLDVNTQEDWQRAEDIIAERDLRERGE